MDAKIQKLETILEKRSGSSLVSTHQCILDLKLELANLYDLSLKKTNGNGNNSEIYISRLDKNIGIIRERIHLLEVLEGEETDSRLKGILIETSSTIGIQI